VPSAFAPAYISSTSGRERQRRRRQVRSGAHPTQRLL